MIPDTSTFNNKGEAQHEHNTKNPLHYDDWFLSHGHTLVQPVGVSHGANFNRLS